MGLVIGIIVFFNILGYFSLWAKQNGIIVIKNDRKFLTFISVLCFLGGFIGIFSARKSYRLNDNEKFYKRIKMLIIFEMLAISVVLIVLNFNSIISSINK